MQLKLINRLVFTGLVLSFFSSLSLADEVGHFITVSGVGKIHAEPDTVWISSGVETQAPTAQLALKENNNRMESVIKTFLSADVEKKNIQTSGFNVRPNYDYSKNTNPPTLTGYQVTNSVMVKLTKLDKLGELLDSMIESGSNQVSGIRFGFNDDEALLDKARTQAIFNASKKARLYADAADVDVGEVISINETSTRIPQPRQFQRVQMMAQEKMMGASEVPVMGGEQQISANVTVVYELKD